MFSCITFCNNLQSPTSVCGCPTSNSVPHRSIEPSITLSKFLGNLKGDRLNESLLSLTLLQGSVLFFDCNCFMSRKRVGGSEGVVHEML